MSTRLETRCETWSWPLLFLLGTWSWPLPSSNQRYDSLFIGGGTRLHRPTWICVTSYHITYPLHSYKPSRSTRLPQRPDPLIYIPILRIHFRPVSTNGDRLISILSHPIPSHHIPHYFTFSLLKVYKLCYDVPYPFHFPSVWDCFF